MIKREFYTQLEGLRGVAVLLVMVSHFLIVPFFGQADFLKFGFWGVNIFYVLSGFLITELLLIDIRENKPAKQLLKGFYLRRVLRIFPIYYLTIILLFFFNVGNTREVSIYTLTYTYNLANVWGGIYSYPVEHFWSLCVEEQFYIFWPLLLVAINKKHHLFLILSLISIGIFSRFIYVGARLPNYNMYLWSTPACFDSLGAGALLAWLKLYRLDLLKKWLKLYLVPLGVFVLFFALAYANRAEINDSFFFNTYARTLTAIVGFFLIGIGALTIPTYYGRIMYNRPLRFAGKISYGLYIYHFILFVLFNDKILAWANNNIDGQLWLIGKLKYNAYIVSFSVLTIVTIAVAYVSFIVIEKPLLSLKSRIN